MFVRTQKDVVRLKALQRQKNGECTAVFMNARAKDPATAELWVNHIQSVVNGLKSAIEVSLRYNHSFSCLLIIIIIILASSFNSCGPYPVHAGQNAKQSHDCERRMADQVSPFGCGQAPVLCCCQVNGRNQGFLAAPRLDMQIHQPIFVLYVFVLYVGAIFPLLLLFCEQQQTGA